MISSFAVQFSTCAAARSAAEAVDAIGLDQAMPTPKGVWNDYEVRVVGQHYTIVRNGVVINEFDNTPGKQSSRPSDPPTDLRQFASGFIGLQNHSDTDLMEFQNIRVRPL